MGLKFEKVTITDISKASNKELNEMIAKFIVKKDRLFVNYCDSLNDAWIFINIINNSPYRERFYKIVNGYFNSLGAPDRKEACRSLCQAALLAVLDIPLEFKIETAPENEQQNP